MNISIIFCLFHTFNHRKPKAELIELHSRFAISICFLGTYKSNQEYCSWNGRELNKHLKRQHINGVLYPVDLWAAMIISYLASEYGIHSQLYCYSFGNWGDAMRCDSMVSAMLSLILVRSMCENEWISKFSIYRMENEWNQEHLLTACSYSIHFTS